MFDLNRRYNSCYNRLIVGPIHMKLVHSSVSYQWVTYQNYKVPV